MKLGFVAQSVCWMLGGAQSRFQHPAHAIANKSTTPI